MKSHIMPVLRLGLSLFLADTCINHPSGTVTTQALIEKIGVYLDVNRVVYNRLRSVKSPVGNFLNITVLELIVSRLICIEVTPDDTCNCRLVVENLSPAYLEDEI